MLKNLLADEGVNSRIVAALRSSGVDVQWIAEISPGMKDRDVLNYAVTHNLLILTEDRDFGELIFAHKISSLGILFIRYTKKEEELIINSILKILELQGDRLLNAFTVITGKKVRIRSLP